MWLDPDLQEEPVMSIQTASRAADLATGSWLLDPARSSAEFEVPSFYGLATVNGRFRRYVGTLNMSDPPAVALVIEADSLDTGNRRRDEHLRSRAFFDAADHPWVRFEADAAELDGSDMQVRGELYAAGKHVPLEVEATVSPVGAEFEIEASAVVDHRELGMRFSPLGMVGDHSRLLVRGRLMRADDRA
jgi:polyisoprenoid-binding protein YceI